jgi:hypothetical protein
VRTYPSEGSGPVLHLALSSHAGAVGAAEETLVRLDTVADDLILQYSQLGARAWIAHTNLPNVCEWPPAIVTRKLLFIIILHLLSILS